MSAVLKELERRINYHRRYASANPIVSHIFHEIDELKSRESVNGNDLSTDILECLPMSISDACSLGVDLEMRGYHKHRDVKGDEETIELLEYLSENGMRACENCPQFPCGKTCQEMVLTRSYELIKKQKGV